MLSATRFPTFGLDSQHAARLNALMFEFTWPRHLRYCTYDCCPLSNRQQVMEIMDCTGVDEHALASGLEVDVQVVEDWLNGNVRPRYSDIDRVCDVCEFDVGPGFGEGSPMLDEREDWGDAEYAQLDPDPNGDDRADMDSAGWMSMSIGPFWDPSVPCGRGNVTRES